MFSVLTAVFVLIKSSFSDFDITQNKGTGVAALALRLGFLISFVRVGLHAAWKRGSHEQIALSATRSGFQHGPPFQSPPRPRNCCQSGSSPIQVRQEAHTTEMHSNRSGFHFSHKQQPLYTPSACARRLCVHAPARVLGTIRDFRAVHPAAVVPRLFSHS